MMRPIEDEEQREVSEGDCMGGEREMEGVIPPTRS